MELFSVIGVVSWLALGIAAAGYHFAYFQRKYKIIAKERMSRDRLHAYMQILWGPIGLLAHFMALENGFSYGWCWPGKDPFAQ